MISQGHVIHEESSLDRLNQSLKDRKGKKVVKLKEINNRFLGLRFGLIEKTHREYQYIKTLINEFKSIH